MLNSLSGVFYDFLPASFNNNTSFPIAANRAGVSECWELNGSKGPAVTQLLTKVLEHRRSRFCPLVIQIVELGAAYRTRKGNPITRQEIDRVNECLRQLDFAIPELRDARFLSSFPSSAPQNEKGGVAPTAARTSPPKPDDKITADLRSQLLALSTFDPQRRGYEFESFLSTLFKAHNLSPRDAFRNRGEQIDGSFVHRHETFLLEAKWQTKEIAVQSLWAFASKVETKSTWAKGLFVSESGFSEDGLHAFRQGKPTPLVCMDGYDIFLLLEHGLWLEEVLDRKKRRAAETGEAFVQVRTLYPNL
ncbi:restriction endonuclease [Bradyrhizobium sp. WSM2793]|uniref:restriction endonuclease n=1 Tax=Bradyrhizobium sp. WSM2793 TaxID=1038866 RepID=UPI0012FCE43E|nr:restriction endonuclease [Bradyrhizobium sp. WSM2793]